MEIRMNSKITQFGVIWLVLFGAVVWMEAPVDFSIAIFFLFFTACIAFALTWAFNKFIFKG